MKFLFKVSALFISLVMTVYCIYLLNQGHFTDFLGSMGMSKYSKTLNWCSNRITKIEGLGSTPWVLKEVDRKWQLTKGSGPAQTVAYLDIEKWLASYCQLHIQLYRNESLLDKHIAPFAKVFFNDQKTAQMAILDQDTYQINEVFFKSEEMDRGIADLKKLLTLP